jgi:hypothetical protein
MSAYWKKAAVMGIFDLPCTRCSKSTPETLLCDHDNPLCPECCDLEHIAACPDCHDGAISTGTIIVGRAANGYPIVDYCPTCKGTGHIDGR